MVCLIAGVKHFLTGVYNLPVCSLREPPQYLRVREVKDWYVDYLMEMLLDEETDHEDLTSPLLVVASVTKRDFKSKNIHSYTYEVCACMYHFQ